ncbi:DnaJ protein-like [Tropilaelaps mercedesae]|uniref:DnaJ protein-like n=1 Tax=Tropilaelaps mercedesae TaxID=418985 RepID=A0A1V9Y093_9ACAR|nr:DnaJ protein-like [Tropilaelaps mercedesae]
MGPGPQLSLRFIILGVHPESTSTEIKTAYLRLCQVHHPDKGGSKHKFSEIQEAFEMRREAFAKSEAAYEEYNKTKMAYDVYGRDGNLKRIFGENVIVLNEQEFENVKQKNDGETKQ